MREGRPRRREERSGRRDRRYSRKQREIHKRRRKRRGKRRRSEEERRRRKRDRRKDWGRRTKRRRIWRPAPSASAGRRRESDVWKEVERRVSANKSSGGPRIPPKALYDEVGWVTWAVEEVTCVCMPLNGVAKFLYCWYLCIDIYQ